MKKPAAYQAILAPRNLRHAFPVRTGTVWDADVIVGVGLHNQAKTIRRCLNSIFEQRLDGRRLAIVLLDDNSKDGWVDALGDLLLRPEVVVLAAHCGSAARARNTILDFVDDSFPQARWIARLDADDRFTSPVSLAAACSAGEGAGARFVLGGNRLLQDGHLLERENPATKDLLNPAHVLSILEDMAEGRAANELPSCNLLLAAGCGWRYPDMASAEDHWMVADLLVNHSNEGAILEAPFYCDYSLGGAVTTLNQGGGRYLKKRRYLFDVALSWDWGKASGGRLLGFGQEGIVRIVDGHVEKLFYPGAITDEAVQWLRHALRGVYPHLPEPCWELGAKGWICRYPHQVTTPADTITLDQAREFLGFCLDRGLVCKNIKRPNFQVNSDGRLTMIDVGNDIIPMDAGYFRDSAARLYGIAALNWPDGELLRRNSIRRQEDVLAEIPGFEAFYQAVLTRYAERQWESAPLQPMLRALPAADNVTLLIKACAMDASVLAGQVGHIVSQLVSPRGLHEIILLIDTYKGPFLRQHHQGDYELLMREAEALVSQGLIHCILLAPDDCETVQAVNLRWFGLDCTKTHSSKGVPVAPQLWAFEQVATRYVLQCDVDVLIGRRDPDHDYLGDMLGAVAGGDDVLGIAFNIPHVAGAVNPYDAPSGEYVPEVRCGLLDLDRIKACRPLPNSLSDGALVLPWYRSLHEHQHLHGLRTLRGGDARSFYVHPQNQRKSDLDFLAVMRDLVAQGQVPSCQLGAWDLEGEADAWSYASRSEDIVFLLKGRNTPKDRLRRCFASLLMQDDQNFGLVVIDDASDGSSAALLPNFLGPLASRSTLIRRHSPKGRIPNFITGIRDICINPETLVVILDLDDALMHRSAVSLLREKWSAGHDVILGGMFRPDKPLKLYSPEFHSPRDTWGGDLWIHLRSFRKRLFDGIPDSAFQLDGGWIEECTDYATMIPIVEASQNPVFIPEYLYFHERTTPRTAEARLRKDRIIEGILAKQAVQA